MSKAAREESRALLVFLPLYPQAFVKINFWKFFFSGSSRVFIIGTTLNLGVSLGFSDWRNLFGFDVPVPYLEEQLRESRK